MRTTKSLDWQLNPTPDFFAGTNRRLRDQASFIFTRRKKERGRSWLHKPMKPQNAPQTAQQESGRSTAPTIQTNHLGHLGTDRSHRKRWRPAPQLEPAPHLDKRETMRLAKQAIAALPTTLTLNLERFPAQSAASLSQHIVSLPIRCTGCTPLGERENARLASHAAGTSKEPDPTPLSFLLRINRCEPREAGQTAVSPPQPCAFVVAVALGANWRMCPRSELGYMYS
jgi:hypothetical protein